MEVSLDVRKSVDENAAAYFESAKKSRRKLVGAEAALKRSGQQLQVLESKKAVSLTKPEKVSVDRKWFEKFRWFVSSEGFLCVGGRDATTNDILVKKHVEDADVVFHTEMQGSPFFVVKSESRQVGKQTLDEAAVAVASFSRAWRLGLSQAEVFYVKPEQLSKTAKPGEYVPKGAFIVRGGTTKIVAELRLAVGMTNEGRVMCAPVDSVTHHCAKLVAIVPGSVKSSDVARLVRKSVGGDIDEIVRSLPSGGCKILAEKKQP
ncbi:DUF814 domain-containing protein [Candidatus Woesearchaeota archaeon]|nr:DUF814 domain-containing protein [Candidatus Woesearchaeota archaeon]